MQQPGARFIFCRFFPHARSGDTPAAHVLPGTVTIVTIVTGRKRLALTAPATWRRLGTPRSYNLCSGSGIVTHRSGPRLLTRSEGADEPPPVSRAAPTKRGAAGGMRRACRSVLPASKDAGGKQPI